MTYPDGIDALVNVNATDSLAAGGHAARHNSVNTALVEIKNMLGPSPAGKIIQIVRATDSTQRSTTSTSFVDASISVTITPQNNTNAILLISQNYIKTVATSGSNALGEVQITDNSNNVISGAQRNLVGVFASGSEGHSATTQIAYATPATENAVTYKLRFKSNVAACTTTLENAVNTGQLYAIEVSA
jgi:hypothetical protein